MYRTWQTKILVLCLGAIGLSSLPAMSAGFRGGKIYALDSDRKALLFTMFADLKLSSGGKRVFSSRYVDPEGHEVMIENAVFDHTALQRYEIDQKQLNERYELQVTGGRLHFVRTRNGRTEESDQAVPPALVVGPSFVPFIQQHWGDLGRGSRVEAQLAVLDRMDTYCFEFERLREVKFDGSGAALIRMRPCSTIVASAVRPVYLTTSLDGSRILQIKGRMLPKWRKSARWVDLDGEAVFAY